VDFGWHLPCYGRLATRDNLILVAREAERRGFESVFVSDHVVLPFEPKTPYGGSRTGAFPIPPTDTFLEPLTALAMVAAVTERVKLGTTVLVLPHRHPVLAAKTWAGCGRRWRSSACPSSAAASGATRRWAP
jgi:alkanesulfonate monooxygenase SsuD/methylene tetrahydromethanopterin reductase-like flavin-dependent oxidoreductase (luciferase family)